MEDKIEPARDNDSILTLYSMFKSDLKERNVSFDRIDDVFKFALQKHKDQKRASGESYIIHPIEVARLSSRLYLDEESIMAAFLHDVIEDTDTTIDEIKKKFGDSVAFLVSALTKINKIEYKSKEENQADNFRRMIVDMAKDIRVILIKLADRLHNMRTMCFLNIDKQKRIALETLNIYAPMAHRLGIYWLKSELEDLSFKYLYPDKFEEIDNRVKESLEKKQEIIGFLKSKLEEDMADAGIKCVIDGRIKYIYSIYKKMLVKHIDFDGVYDLIALRIITDSIRDCYAALGIIHSKYKPLPGRFKDYIAIPKQNMYQSLHTTVFGAGDVIVEIQIRTRMMHEIAEEGIAAHYKYKEGKQYYKSDKQFIWLKRLVEWQNELKNPKEFLDTMQVDLFSGEVYVFTPAGDLKVLPRDATPIDFAYAIHTEIGNTCVGAKVNGKIVPLKYKLISGDIVEIFTQSNHSPSRDWLGFVISSKAKSKIRQKVREGEKKEAFDIGKNIMMKELAKLNISFQNFLKEEKLKNVLSYFGISTTNDLFERIGFGRISAASVLSRLYQSDKTEIKPVEKNIVYKVSVDGIDNISIRLAKCCKPSFGDKIIGFVTKSRGIVIHKQDCENVIKFEMDDRLVEAVWEGDNKTILNKVNITAYNKIGVLAYVTNAISKYNINTKRFFIDYTDSSETKTIFKFELELPHKAAFDDLLKILRKNENILNISREK